MATFKDQNGREWMLKLHAPLIAEVRKACNVDLASIESFEQLSRDPVLLVNVLWCCVRKQAGSTTDEQFGEALAGDAIERAVEALLAAFQDFCPASTRNLIAKAMSKARGVEAKQEELMDALLERHFRDHHEKIATQLTSVTSALALSESTPKA